MTYFEDIILNLNIQTKKFYLNHLDEYIVNYFVTTECCLSSVFLSPRYRIKPIEQETNNY